MKSLRILTQENIIQIPIVNSEDNGSLCNVRHVCETASGGLRHKIYLFIHNEIVGLFGKHFSGAQTGRSE